MEEGFLQWEGRDFLETFSFTPVSSSFVWMTAVTALERDWVLNRLVIWKACIESEIDHEIFLMFPDGCNKFSGKVVKLNKPLYGPRQSPMVFNQLLMSKLVAFGGKQCASNPCICRLTSLDEEARLVGGGVYVDNLILNSETKCCRELKAFLQYSFPTKDLGGL